MRITHKLALVVVAASAALLAFGALSLPRAKPVEAGTVIALQAPDLGAGQQGVEAPLAQIGDEAGIAAYYNAGMGIDLNAARAAFRTIEVQTAQYLIGSVPVLNHPEAEDVHVYVSADGWLMAYYLDDDPTAKMFDFRAYTGGNTIPTKHENVLAVVASAAGVPYIDPTFYDFRYPNANRLMLIAEDGENGNNFSVWLPSNFVFYERSWGMYSPGWSGTVRLNGTSLGGCEWGNCQGLISSAQMPANTTHTIGIEPDANDKGGLALTYRIP